MCVMQIYLVDNSLLYSNAKPVQFVDQYLYPNATPVEIVTQPLLYPDAKACYIANPFLEPNALQVYEDPKLASSYVDCSYSGSYGKYDKTDELIDTLWPYGAVFIIIIVFFLIGKGC